MARKKNPAPRPGDTPDAPPRVRRTYSDLDATRRVLATLEPGYTPSPGWYTERVDLEEARREVDALEEAADALEDAEAKAEDLAARIEARDATIEDLEARIATLEELVEARRAAP